MAQKLAEEAAEVVIEAVRGERSAVISESVDLSTISLCCGANLGSPPQRSGPKRIAARRCLGWRRSCRRKSGWAQRPPPGTRHQGRSDAARCVAHESMRGAAGMIASRFELVIFDC